ncbi:MAG: hypothetical protein ACP5IF_07755 [Conexivisphaera sp.]
MSTMQIRRTPLGIILCAMYSHFPGPSLGRTSGALRATMRRSHTSIWKWVRRYRYS